MRCATATSPRVPRAKALYGALTRPPSFRRMASAAAPAPTALPAQAEGMRALRAAVEDKSRRTKTIEGLRALREGPDAKSVFLLDQFGVLHDGKVAYPCAIETVRRLHESGARLFIISNSSRRASGTLKKLGPMGFDPDWFEGVITSGEITHRKLNSRNDLASRSADELVSESDAENDEGSIDPLDEAFGELGDRCLHFTWSKRGAVALDGIEGLVTVDAETFLEQAAEKEPAPSTPPKYELMSRDAAPEWTYQMGPVSGIEATELSKGKLRCATFTAPGRAVYKMVKLSGDRKHFRVYRCESIEADVLEETAIMEYVANTLETKSKLFALQGGTSDLHGKGEGKAKIVAVCRKSMLCDDAQPASARGGVAASVAGTAGRDGRPSV